MSRRLRRALLLGGALVVAASTALEALVPDPHRDEPGWTGAWYHQLPGWNGVLGLAGGALLVVVAKGVAARWLQRTGGYYDD